MEHVLDMVARVLYSFIYLFIYFIYYYFFNDEHGGYIVGT